MARACTVCVHRDRDDVDQAVVSGGSLRAVAETFGLSKDAVRRHKSHIAPALVALGQKVKVVADHQDEDRRVLTLLERIENLVGKIERLADTAEGEGKANQLLAAADRLDKLYRLIGNVTGELDDRPQNVVNVLTMPEWLHLRAAVLDVLKDFPDAYAALVSKLSDLEGIQGGQRAVAGLPSGR